MDLSKACDVCDGKITTSTVEECGRITTCVQTSIPYQPEVSKVWLFRSQERLIWNFSYQDYDILWRADEEKEEKHELQDFVWVDVKS